MMMGDEFWCGVDGGTGVGGAGGMGVVTDAGSVSGSFNGVRPFFRQVEAVETVISG